mgnify:CR=1 FL=1
MPGMEGYALLRAVRAARAAQVRWGNDAEDELVLAHDPDIRLALEQFGTLTRLLAQP